MQHFNHLARQLPNQRRLKNRSTSALTFMFNFKIIESIIEKCLLNARPLGWGDAPSRNESENDSLCGGGIFSHG